VNLLVNTGFVSGDTAAKMRDDAGDFAVLPLPVATIERGSASIATELAPPPASINNAYFDIATNKWVSHDNPGNYNLSYTVTFWAIKQYTINHIEEWLYSQLGKKGAASNEMFLDVKHPTPWGTYKQSLKFESFSDISELEGENPVYRRLEMSVQVRMLHFRPAGTSADPIQMVVQDTTNLDPRDGTSWASPGNPDLVAPTDISGNLFIKYVPNAYIPTKWAKEGPTSAVTKAVLAPSDGSRTALENGLQVKVKVTADIVDVAHRLILLDSNTRALVSVSFQYQADYVTTMRLDQRSTEDGTASDVYTLSLPATGLSWKRVQFFAPITENIMGLTVEGRGTAATVHLADINIRHLQSLTTVEASESTVGSNREFTWTGLSDSTAYLVHGQLTPSASETLVNVSVQDDSSAATFTRTLPLSTLHRGVASVIQPKSGGSTVKVIVPTTLTVTSGKLRLQPYGGDFTGHDI
jgi:hypothetical protein